MRFCLHFIQRTAATCLTSGGKYYNLIKNCVLFQVTDEREIKIAMTTVQQQTSTCMFFQYKSHIGNKSIAATYN